MSSGINNDLEQKIYQAASNPQQALRLGSIPNVDGTKEITFTIVALNKKTGEWINTATLQNNTAIMEKINAIAETIICSHRDGHPNLPMENISYIDRNGIHLKESDEIVRHSDTLISKPELNEKFESIIYPDLKKVIEFEKKLVNNEIKETAELEKEIKKFPESELKGHLNRAVKDGVSFNTKANNVLQELRLHLQQCNHSADISQISEEEDLFSELVSGLNSNARKPRTAQEPWLALTNVISSYYHNSQVTTSSFFESTSDDDGESLFSTVNFVKPTTPAWAQSAPLSSIGYDSSDDETSIEDSEESSATESSDPLPPPLQTVHKPVQPPKPVSPPKDSDIELFVSIKDKGVVPPKPSIFEFDEDSWESGTDNQESPSAPVTISNFGEVQLTAGEYLLNVSKKLERLEDIHSDVLFNYSNPALSKEVLQPLIDHFELSDEKKDFSIRAINWVKVQERTLLKEMIQPISKKIFANDSYQGDTIEEKYILFYLATVFTIIQKGELLKNPSTRPMDQSELIFLFRLWIPRVNQTVNPSKVFKKMA